MCLLVTKMRTYYIICVVVIYGYTTGCGSAETKAVHTTTLYTDLIDIIGKNNSCGSHVYEDISKDDNLFAKQGIDISTYKFHDVNLPDAVIGKCDVINIQSRSLAKYSWTCFATDNSTSRDPNWFFVSCRNFKIISVKCLNIREVPAVSDNLCREKAINERNYTCHDFSYGKGKHAVCSRNFRLKKLVRNNAVNQASYTDLEDIMAYLSAAFILVTFLLAVVIPSEKCKPTYKFDKEQALRVPLEIYEMYGVSYQPSAKKKRNQKPLNMEVIPAISSHLSNVAAVENNPIDWKGYKTQFNFTYNQPLFQAMERGLGEKIKGDPYGKETNEEIAGNNDFDNKGKRASINSIGSVGTFDYTLFNNDPESVLDSMTSETYNDENQQSVGGGEGVQEYRNTNNDDIKAEEIGKDNKGFMTELTSAKSNDNTEFTRYDNGDECSIGENKEYNKENELIEKYKDDGKNIYDSDDSEFENVYMENYEKENMLSPIYEDSREQTTCTCDNKSDLVSSSGSCVSSSNNEDVVRVKTITEFQTFEKIVTEGCTENVDVSNNSEAMRPRISITVKFPKNFGIKSGTKVEHISTEAEETEGKFNMKRSLSATKAPINRNSSQLSRKFSLC